MIKAGETVWPRLRLDNLRAQGGKTRPFKSKDRVWMIVICERTPTQRGDFPTAALAADYDEHLLFALGQHFNMHETSKVGHGQNDHYGEHISELAAADVDG